MFDLESPVPYHLQIREILKKEITDGVYTERIPSERELIARFNVSRTTIREAINHLVNEGTLKKIHGKGTFIVKNKHIHEWLDSINSLTETIKKMGMEPGAKLLQNEQQTVSDNISLHMERDVLHLIKRLRTADDIPIAIESHYYHPELGKLLQNFDLNAVTIYKVLENDLHVSMDEAEQSISCKPIQEDDAIELGIEAGTNVLYVERFITNSLGEPIEYYTSVIKPDMYVFRMRIKK